MGEQKEIFDDGYYKAVFSRNQESWDYSLNFEMLQVTGEELNYQKADIPKSNVLHRGQGHLGRIKAEDIDDKPKIRFKADARQIAIVSKRDAIQHPFLEALHEWASSVRHFRFSGEMNPTNLAIAIRGPTMEINEKDTNQVVPIFHKAMKQFADAFKTSVINDMRELGYDVSDLEIRRPANIVVHGLLPGEPMGVSATEENLKCPTDQTMMSHGMFRTLSLLIQLTYYAMRNKGGCILIDDIGEGLDFERSCILVDMIRKKAYDSSMQVVMTTNNRFVMNKVPLEEWCVLQRDGSRVRARNYANSRAAFERFKVTGLNNFDLLATDYLDKVKLNG